MQASLQAEQWACMQAMPGCVGALASVLLLYTLQVRSVCSAHLLSSLHTGRLFSSACRVLRHRTRDDLIPHTKCTAFESTCNHCSMNPACLQLRCGEEVREERPRTVRPMACQPSDRVSCKVPMTSQMCPTIFCLRLRGGDDDWKIVDSDREGVAMPDTDSEEKGLEHDSKRARVQRMPTGAHASPQSAASADSPQRDVPMHDAPRNAGAASHELADYDSSDDARDFSDFAEVEELIVETKARRSSASALPRLAARTGGAGEGGRGGTGGGAQEFGREALEKALREQFGLPSFRAGQEETIARVLRGSNAPSS